MWHPTTLNTIINLAYLLKEMGRVEEAIPLFREELEGQREMNGSTHEDTLGAALNLAELLDESGRTEEAARLRSEYCVQVHPPIAKRVRNSLKRRLAAPRDRSTVRSSQRR